MKKVESMVVISFSSRINLDGLKSFVGAIPQEIEQVAKDQGFEISGNQIWAYEGCDGNPETVFNLKICLPIKTSNQKLVHEKFKIEELSEMQVKSTIHKGAWQEIGKTYCTIFGELINSNHKPTGHTREIYEVVDFVNQQNCITEVQVEYI